MAIFTPLAGLTPVQRRAFIAAFLGALSQRIDRRITIMACCVLGALVIPFWTGAATPTLLAAGAFAAVFILTAIGRERRGISFTEESRVAA